MKLRDTHPSECGVEHVLHELEVVNNTTEHRRDGSRHDMPRVLCCWRSQRRESCSRTVSTIVGSPLMQFRAKERDIPVVPDARQASSLKVDSEVVVKRWRDSDRGF